jgi:hypothetical protein
MKVEMLACINGLLFYNDFILLLYISNFKALGLGEKGAGL